MGYDHYKAWVRSLPQDELETEVRKTRNLANNSTVQRVRAAWKRLLDACVEEAQRRARG